LGSTSICRRIWIFTGNFWKIQNFIHIEKFSLNFMYRLDSWNGPHLFFLALATSSANMMFQVWQLPLFSGNCLSCLATASRFWKTYQYYGQD
jgi:hypothetical protein